MIKCALVTFLFFLVLLPGQAFGQKETANQGLSFFTKHEELYFKNVVNGNTKQLFNLFLSLDSSYSRKAMVMNSNYYFSHLRTIQSIPKPTKKYSKYLKSVYDDLHSKFLRKYNLENSFSQVFTKGEYNCVSAVMLYSLTLDGIGIPYEIKETPSHVYLVASPGNEQILIETTDPVNGFNNITTAFKQNFVKTLVENKLVGSSEYNGTNTNELFDQYYFKAKSISLAQLAGLQYFNSGIFFFEKKDYHKAYQQFQKSYSLYANDKTESLAYAAGATYLSETDYASLLPVRILASLLKFEKNKPSKNEVEGEFARITNEMLNDRYDTKMYDAAYELLSLNIEDLSLQTNIDYIYNYERGRHMVIRNQFKEAIPYLENAYVIKPSNIETENLFVANLAASLEGEKHFSEDVEKISIRHPSLQRNSQFTSLVLASYLLEMHDNYSRSRPNEGNFFKMKFENGIEGKQQTFKDHDMIGWAYSQAAVYHFKKGETSKAKSILQKGLEYSPNNYELKSRLLMIAR